MQMPSLLCLFNRHRVRRSTVKWDGLDFVGTCRNCGTRVRRKAHRTWRRDWLDAAGEAPDEP